MGYRAKTVSELTGIPKSTLLAWERRHGLVSPERADNRYREYTDADVARFRAIKALIDQGYKVSEAISLASEPTAGEAPGEALFAALTSMNRAGADAVLARLYAWSFSDLVRRLFFPVLRQVGDAWARGEITVAQEHFASAYLQQQMGTMLLRLGGGPAEGPAAVLTGMAGEQHSLGVLGLAIELTLRGWRVAYLGPDTPLQSLLPHLINNPPKLVGIGVQHTIPPVELERYVRAVRAALPESCRVVVGGAGVPEQPPELAGVQWARGYADALRPS